MPPPSKEGLDYFPFDVDLLSDRKLRRLKLKYGYLSVMVYISILSILYKDKGYYIDYSDEKREDVLWEIMNLLQGKYQPAAETVAEIIEELVACELFSGDQFNSKIITSNRAQRTYYRSTIDRKTVNIDFDKWLLSEEEMKSLSNRSIILSNYQNRPNNEDNRPNNEDNRPNNRDNRPNKKESKVKKSKVNNIISDSSDTDIYFKIILYLNDKANKNFKHNSKTTQRHINARLNEGYTYADFCKVIDVKTAQWSRDKHMCKYLRPETLFGTKFESYLNETEEVNDGEFERSRQPRFGDVY